MPVSTTRSSRRSHPRTSPPSPCSPWQHTFRPRTHVHDTDEAGSPTARIHDDVTQLVGGTPLVRLNHLARDLAAALVVKLEFYNPTNSVKDRIGVAIVDAAERSGARNPGHHHL